MKGAANFFSKNKQPNLDEISCNSMQQIYIIELIMHNVQPYNDFAK